MAGHSGLESDSVGPAVGIIGLGGMGLPMARHLAEALPQGVHVTARHAMNVTDEVGSSAIWHEDARSLAAACDEVLLMVPDLPQVRDVLEGPSGLLAGFSDRGREPARVTGREPEQDVIVVICSTVSPHGLVELDRYLRERTDGHVHLVDAPVSGGREGASAGNLAVMVGGAEEDVARVLPALRTFGDPVHLGALGAGEISKACNQLIVGATVEALGEAAVLAERSGLDVAALFELLKGGYADSRLLELNKDRFVNHDHTPSGPARFLVKDLGFALDSAEDTQTPTPLADTVHGVFADLTERGFGDENLTVVQSYLEGLPRAGRRPPFETAASRLDRPGSGGSAHGAPASRGRGGSATRAVDIVVMGVSGCGKTTVGELLAERLGLPFAEGDDVHSEASRRKMASGRPLTDEDRWPWLRRLRAWMDEQNAHSGGGIVACSALKRSYRDVLRDGGSPVLFCHLDVDEPMLRSRMAHRPGHYMPASLLDSQLETLEPLQPDEQGVTLSARAEPELVLSKVLAWLGAKGGAFRSPHEPAARE